MNTSTKHFLPRIISAVIAVLLALTVAVPAMGAPTAGDNLTITIKNNTGLPAMKAGMFDVYQLFKGTPQYDGPITDENPWGATSWNNYVLADIEWGVSVTKPSDFLTALKGVSDGWASDEFGTLFDSVETAADLANVLVGKDNEFMQHFAKWLVDSEQLTALSGNQITEDVVLGDSATAADDKIIYQVKDAGYYLLAEKNKIGVVNTAESEYIIAVLGNQTINLKASIPTVRKYIKIVEGTDTKKIKGTSADINETLTFLIEGKLPKNYSDFVNGYEYIFHDNVPDSYKDITDMVVTIATDTDGDGKPDEIFTLKTDQYEVKTNSGTFSDIDCTQEIVISNLRELEGKPDKNNETININKDSVISVEYKVKLSEKAKLGNAGTTSNRSSVVLQYSNDINAALTSSSRTSESNVYVYTYGLDLKKVESARETGLAGAGFLLYKTEGENTFYAKFDTLTNSDTREVIGYRFNSWVDAATVTPLIDSYKVAKETYDNASNDSRADSDSDENTALKNALDALKVYLLNSSNVKEKIGEIPDITGISADTYDLKEVVTPAGYNTMTDYEFTISETINSVSGILTEFKYKPTSGTEVTYSASGTPDVIAIFNSGLIPDKLTNIKAPLLPFTGGIGTVIFYVLGGALVAGAIVYIIIIAKNRRKETENSDK